MAKASPGGPLGFLPSASTVEVWEHLSHTILFGRRKSGSLGLPSPGPGRLPSLQHLPIISEGDRAVGKNTWGHLQN